MVEEIGVGCEVPPRLAHTPVRGGNLRGTVLFRPGGLLWLQEKGVADGFLHIVGEPSR